MLGYDSMTAVRFGLSWLALAAVGCGAIQPSIQTVRPTRLAGTDGVLHALPAAEGGFILTVLVFFSAHCDCQAAHDQRLIQLARGYQRRGVAFFAVDSEVGAALERDGAEARRRRYPYPILIDSNAELARSLQAEYATYSVVLDRMGRVRYRGGIDTDLVHLRSDATAYLSDALDDLLAGRQPRRAYGETLGCSLLTR
jgi:hypothetical protein